MEDIPTTTLPKTPPPTPFPPTSIPPQPPTPLTPTLPAEYTSPTALRLPTTWRCGTCASLHPIITLLRPISPTSSPPTGLGSAAVPDEGVHCACDLPSLQAVYDQFGALYLFWRDDPAVSDLRVPGMAEEARWRVWRAGGGEWDFLLGAGEGLEGSSGEGVVDLKVREGVARRWSDVSESSTASDESEGSVRVV